VQWIVGESANRDERIRLFQFGAPVESGGTGFSPTPQNRIPSQSPHLQPLESRIKKTKKPKNVDDLRARRTAVDALCRLACRQIHVRIQK
jgi:hypothetical protein